MLENVSVDVVDGARVKGVLGCPSVPGGREGVKTYGQKSVEIKNERFIKYYFLLEKKDFESAEEA